MAAQQLRVPPRDPPAPQPLPRARRGGARGRGPRVADPRASSARRPRSSSATPRRSGAAARRSGCCAAASRRTRWPRRCAAPARASCTRTTSSRRSAGARWRRRARRARASCCTCTTTASSAPSAPASRAGEDCTRCHGRDTLPGVRLNCRGGSRAESAAYGAGLALWQRRLAASADAFVVPSAFALRPAGAARRAARRPRARDPLRPAHVRGALARGRRDATRSTRAG